MTSQELQPEKKSSTPMVWAEKTDRTHELYFWHECNGGREITQSLPGVIWQIVQLAPLTVRQRINCGFCKLSGWFRDGKWQDIA